MHLLVTRRLHLRRTHLHERVTIPDGRSFIVYRHTISDAAGAGTPVTLAVWFRLWAVPPGARLRQWVFERESILNTILYAGAPGYRAKLWMIDRETSVYAGLYEWRGEAAARTYGNYITAVLRPLSARGSTGFELLPDQSLEDYLTSPLDTPS